MTRFASPVDPRITSSSSSILGAEKAHCAGEGVDVFGASTLLILAVSLSKSPWSYDNIFPPLFTLCLSARCEARKKEFFTESTMLSIRLLMSSISKVYFYLYLYVTLGLQSLKIAYLQENL